MASQRGKHTTFGVLVIFLFGQDRLELRRDHGRDHGSQRPVTRVSHPYHAAPTGHIQVPTRHGDKRRTEPSRHRAATRLLALPPTVAQVDGGPGRTSPSTEGRGSRDRLCLCYPVRWPLPAHTQTILVVRISRPLDALDFVKRITKELQLPTDIFDDRAQCRTAPCRRPRACKTNGSTCRGAVKLELRGRR